MRYHIRSSCCLKIGGPNRLRSRLLGVSSEQSGAFIFQGPAAAGAAAAAAASAKRFSPAAAAETLSSAVAASILELERKDTLTVDAINTAAKLVCRDGKEGENACRPFLELNLVRYGSFKYTHYMDNIEPYPSPSLP